jgi:apolipoprotein D and lipocalin family protein
VIVVFEMILREHLLIHSGIAGSTIHIVTESFLLRKKHMFFTRLRPALILISSLLSACTTLPPPGIRPVSGFNLQRYSGKWYEIARLDHSFEHGMEDVSADYTPRDGSLTVLNRGYDTATKAWKQVNGKARFNADPQTASLKVSFFRPFYGGYHVVALDPDYHWAMVAGNDRSYLWILARDKNLSADVISRLLEQARNLGFDTSKLIWVSQTRADG